MPRRPTFSAAPPAAAARGLSGAVYRAHGPLSSSSPAEEISIAVPQSIVAEVKAGLGIDAESTTIHRGPSVSRKSAALGARAFSQQGEVFLPDEAGSLDDRDTRALLVHELVHADQQRAFGADLPGEESAAGRELEVEATAAEQWYLGDGPPPVIVRPDTEPARPVAAIQRAGGSDLSDVVGRIDALGAEVAALREQHIEQHDDARGLDRLAGRLYRHIRSRLRAELIIDRERAGLLADLGGVR